MTKVKKVIKDLHAVSKMGSAATNIAKKAKENHKKGDAAEMMKKVTGVMKALHKASELPRRELPGHPAHGTSAWQGESVRKISSQDFQKIAQAIDDVKHADHRVAQELEPKI
jgi:hypothetical protein